MMDHMLHHGGNVFDKESIMQLEMGSHHSDNDTLMKPFNSEVSIVNMDAEADADGVARDIPLHERSSRSSSSSVLNDENIDTGLKKISEEPTMAETNGYDKESQTYIEIATYAGVDVYECYTKDKPPCLIMRRCADNWLNITQVFKAGSFTKAQRTKILEKEANEIKHEKIQGGYGRFQGTWIPWESTKYLVEKYNINSKVVKRIVEFIPDPNDMPPKRSKVSQIKKLDPNARITSPSAYKKTPKKNSKTPMKKKSVRKSSKKEKTIQPSPLQNIMFQTPQQHQQNQTENQSTEKLSTLPSEQETPMVPVSKVNPGIISQANHPIKYQTTQKPLQFYPYPQAHQFQQMVPGSSNGAPLQVNTSHSSLNPQGSMKMMKQMMQTNGKSMGHSTGSIVSNITSNGSSMEIFSSHDKSSSSSSESPTPVAQLNEKATASPEHYKELILEVLSSEYDSVEPPLPEALYRPPSNFDIDFLIDDQGHTSLHWAVAMSNIPLIKVLLVQNADLFRCNNKGFNCLTKSVFYNNCYKTGSFQQIISMLHPCLITPDANDRLPLHYLVELTVNKSKEPHVIEFYMDTILDTLAKEDEKLLRMSLNHQDTLGNTPLHLAALNKNVDLCQKLVYFGVSPDILSGENQTISMILSRFTVPNIFQPSLPAQFLQSPPKTAFLSNTPRNSQEDHIEDTSKYEFNDTTMDSIQVSATRTGGHHLPDRTNDILSMDKMKGSLTPAIKLHPPSPPTLLKSKNRISKPPHAEKVRKLQEPAYSAQEHEQTVKTSTTKTTSQLRDLTGSLTNIIDNSLANLQYEIQLKEEQINEIEHQLKHTTTKEKSISEANNQKTLASIQHQLKMKNIELDNYMERSQALSLATLVQDEENSFPRTSSAEATSEVEKKEAVKLIVELCYKQFKRRQLIRRIKHARDQLVSDTKISKFRKLIGMSIDNIDSKLNDIEQDLRSMERTQCS